ncbi:membrane fusion protein (multidrug efflux system) [Chitinophaga skermanii]|uniref:Membrane fusion protein (Multidrug efflux system) n=1 Tax=Chitinophaga skermanii TaxID=331697 RepID=A0A327R286_9BACT|nr:efflux RND transporter periplasmic adaptor subunit [Chitinophaga skermanii]RAJ10926.1 membrane fusion protein (multidrug efflux system) [Chitinophaga skermanii]
MQPSTFRRFQLHSLLLAGSITPMVILLAACGGKKSAAPPSMGPTPVVATTIKASSYTVTENFPATLTANHVVEVRSDVTGFLEAIKVPDGSTVTKGQVLYEIDRSRYGATVEQSQASVAQAEADLAQKQRDFDRYNALLEKDAISKQTVDQAKTAVMTSKANLAAMKAQLARTNTDLTHSVLRAPVSGSIGIASIRVGDIVNAGQTLINTIVNEDPMYVDIDVPQQRYREFATALAHQTATPRSYFLTFNDQTTYEEQGKILLVNNTVDQQTGTIRVRLSFPNAKRELKSGMTAVLQVRYQTPDDQVAIPAKAIRETLAEVDVLTVDEHNVVRSNKVVRGAIVDSMLIITQGLKIGDKVITEGMQKVRPGDTVRVQLR